MGLPRYSFTELVDAANLRLPALLARERPEFALPRDAADGPLVSERKVRTYLSRDLLPRAFGAGRGAHYDERHLERLLVVELVRRLDDRDAVTLDDVRRGLDELTIPEIRDIALGHAPAPQIRTAREADARRRGERLDVDRDRDRSRGPDHDLTARNAYGGDFDDDRPSGKKKPPSRRRTRELDRDGDEVLAIRQKRMAMSGSPGSPRDFDDDDRKRIAAARIPSSRRRVIRIFEAILTRLRFYRDEGPAAGEPLPRTKEASLSTWHRVEVTREVEIHVRGPLEDEDLLLIADAGTVIAELRNSAAEHRRQEEARARHLARRAAAREGGDTDADTGADLAAGNS